MRQRYIVTYDIADPRRLRLVFKLLNTDFREARSANGHGA
jgi:CRISPR/Cas system-associated endoribonuclease Cas2